MAPHPALSDEPRQATLRLRAGDAVALDYRVLHGTHANASPARRDCLVLTFAPSWHALPDDVRGHLISHPALPNESEDGPLDPVARELLPRYDGPRRDLPPSRDAPSSFAVG